MKKVLLLPVAALAIFISSCSGNKEYDAYVASLNRQIQAVDSISTPAEFCARLDSLQEISTAFDQAGVELNDDQKAEIDQLSMRLQEAFTAAYERIASTPTTLPDAIEVPE